VISCVKAPKLQKRAFPLVAAVIDSDTQECGVFGNSQEQRERAYGIALLAARYEILLSQIVRFPQTSQITIVVCLRRKREREQIWRMSDVVWRGNDCTFISDLRLAVAGRRRPEEVASR